MGARKELALLLLPCAGSKRAEVSWRNLASHAFAALDGCALEEEAALRLQLAWLEWKRRMGRLSALRPEMLRLGKNKSYLAFLKPTPGKESKRRRFARRVKRVMRRLTEGPLLPSPSVKLTKKLNRHMSGHVSRALSNA